MTLKRLCIVLSCNAFHTYIPLLVYFFWKLLINYFSFFFCNHLNSRLPGLPFSRILRNENERKKRLRTITLALKTVVVTIMIRDCYECLWFGSWISTLTVLLLNTYFTCFHLNQFPNFLSFLARVLFAWT